MLFVLRGGGFLHCVSSKNYWMSFLTFLNSKASSSVNAFELLARLEFSSLAEDLD